MVGQYKLSCRFDKQNTFQRQDFALILARGESVLRIRTSLARLVREDNHHRQYGRVQYKIRHRDKSGNFAMPHAQVSSRVIGVFCRR
jgi:hypothetical protein